MKNEYVNKMSIEIDGQEFEDFGSFKESPGLKSTVRLVDETKSLLIEIANKHNLEITFTEQAYQNIKKCLLREGVMPAYNFKKEFAEKVESGLKRQTIRKTRKDGKRPVVGTTAYLYAGMRTKNCKKLGEHVIKSVHNISIKMSGVYIDNVHITSNPLIKLAQLDGFDSYTAMFDFFFKTHGLPFEGHLIKW